MTRFEPVPVRTDKQEMGDFLRRSLHRTVRMDLNHFTHGFCRVRFFRVGHDDGDVVPGIEMFSKVVLQIGVHLFEQRSRDYVQRLCIVGSGLNKILNEDFCPLRRTIRNGLG